jgi:hypothetical protein
MNGANLTLTLPNPPPNATWNILIQNLSGTTLTISSNGLNINGTATNGALIGANGQVAPAAVYYTDGSNYFAQADIPEVWSAVNGFITSYVGGAPQLQIGSGTGGTNTGLIVSGATFTEVLTNGGGVQGQVFIGQGGQSVSGCTLSAAAGSAGSGKFVAGVAACTATITLPSATNGWACKAQDITTPADAVNQSAFTTTSATVTGTVVVNDVIVYQCMGF